MKSILFSIAVCISLFCFNPLFAQEKQIVETTHTSTSEKQKTYYVDKLNLDEEQAETFEAINKKFEEDVRSLKIKSKSKKAVKKLKALEELRDNDIKALLSEEKFKEYIKLRREKRNSLKTLIRKSNGQ